MTEKIRVAFIKFGGLSAGGTERWLQMMAANLDRSRFEVDYYYCDAAPYVGADFKHTNTNDDRLRYMKDHGVNLIKFKVGAKDITKTTHDWVDTDFWQIFDQTKYDIVQTAKAGPAEYPYHLLKIPVVEYVTLSAGVDFSKNIACTIHLSNWQRVEWYRGGGKLEKSTVIPIPVFTAKANGNLRRRFNIGEGDLVAGFHQRNDDAIFSPIPLQAFAKLQEPKRHFMIMGGGEKYRSQAKALGLKNVHFVEHNASDTALSEFLNSLDIFAHGRGDGETFGTVLAEAMFHGKPCLSHRSPIANAQPETMGPGGLFARDEYDYSEKLATLFARPELRTKLGRKGLEHALHHYTVEQCTAELGQIYEKVHRSVSDNVKPDFSSTSYALSPLGFLIPGHLEKSGDLANHVFTQVIPQAALVEAVCFLGKSLRHLVTYNDAGSGLSTFAFCAVNAQNLAEAYVADPKTAAMTREVVRLNNFEERLLLIDAEAPRSDEQGTVYLFQNTNMQKLQGLKYDFNKSDVLIFSAAFGAFFRNSPLVIDATGARAVFKLSHRGRFTRTSEDLLKNGKVSEARSGSTFGSDSVSDSSFDTDDQSYYISLPLANRAFVDDFETFIESHNKQLLKNQLKVNAKRLKRFIKVSFREWGLIKR